MPKLDFLFAIAAIASVSACSAADTAAARAANAPDASAPDASASAATYADAGDASTPDDAPATLSDSQIIGVVSAADDGEIQEGQLATTSASDPDVRAFAASMVSEHTTTSQELTAIEAQASLTSDASSYRDQVQENTVQAMNALPLSSGHSFDTAYVDTEIDAQSQELALLDAIFIPTAKNAALKTLLQDTRTLVAKDLEHAHALAFELAGDGSAPDASLD